MTFLAIGTRVLHCQYRPGNATKRPIVFSNSLGTDLRIWDPVIAALDPEIPVLSMDKSGHGLSENGAETIADHADDVAGLMDHFGLTGALVCGVSMGGQIAQSLATRHPDRVAALCLSNTASKIGTAEAWSDRIAALDSGGIAPMADQVLERWLSPGYLASQSTAVAGWRAMLTRQPLDGYRACCAAIRDADLTETTRALSVPTLCLAGSDDQATPPDVVRALAALIPGARYQELPGVGHIPAIEAPELTAKILMDLYGEHP